ncbi:Predicted kinase, aminoglycoside phosphotransferase (APT) family [Sphingopyxis sp. YR583]|uniref:phosphotransferase family protein n=1 Tax=Sphingopyxis sp. YR583 TaxID=1881047 RepID=UPI0008A8037A|nr:phosphotransferase family protein [Sphingopyxis sp. YR583]SEH19237.1 Predicted kinase, aminoglycoside phosphotransferase (APT) family [Sphingopyxis sp. YR583]
MTVDGVGSLSALRSLAADATQVSEENIADFVRSHGGEGDISVVFTNGNLAAGASGGTLMFDLHQGQGGAVVDPCVLRFDLGSDGIFAQVSLKDQFEIMRALGEFGLKVPDVRWLDTEGRIVEGADALVMGRIEALTPCIQYLQIGPYAEASVAERDKMLAGLMRFVAQLHAVPAADLGVASLYSRGGEGAYFIDREIDWAQAELHARFPEVEEGERAALHTEMRSTIDAVADVLKRTAPRGLAPTICHGDPTFANAMFDEDRNLVAMLDWELCHHGLPAEDVTYFLSAARVIASLGSTKADPPDRDLAIAAYEAAGGKLDHWDFAAALSTFRLATWGAIGMRRMPREHWEGQRLMWELQRSELVAALEALGETV